MYVPWCFPVPTSWSSSPQHPTIPATRHDMVAAAAGKLAAIKCQLTLN